MSLYASLSGVWRLFLFPVDPLQLQSMYASVGGDPETG